VIIPLLISMSNNNERHDIYLLQHCEITRSMLVYFLA
jgi:hypothetical protein